MEAFTLPTGGGAVNVARRAVLAPLQFLDYVNVRMLTTSGSLPLKRLADLSGYLGACATHAARYAPTGTPAASGNLLSSICGPLALADGLRARNVAKTLDRVLLPSTLRAITLTEEALAGELEDGIAYRSSPMGARNILEHRISCLAPSAPTLDQYILSLSPDSHTAYNLVCQLHASILPVEQGAASAPADPSSQLLGASHWLCSATCLHSGCIAVTAASSASAAAKCWLTRPCIIRRFGCYSAHRTPRSTSA